MYQEDRNGFVQRPYYNVGKIYCILSTAAFQKQVLDFACYLTVNKVAGYKINMTAIAFLYNTS